MPQQLDQNCLDNFKEPGQGVVRVRAGEERGCIVCESGFAPVGRASQGLEFKFGDLTRPDLPQDELGEDGGP